MEQTMKRVACSVVHTKTNPFEGRILGVGMNNMAAKISAEECISREAAAFGVTPGELLALLESKGHIRVTTMQLLAWENKE